MKSADEPRPARHEDVRSVLHAPMEFDMADDCDLGGVAVLETSPRCEVLHPAQEFDAAAAVWISLSLRSECSAPPPDLTQVIAGLLHALDREDRAQGGHGLMLDPSRSVEAGGEVFLVLHFVADADAATRLRRLADALGCALEADAGLPPRATASQLPQAIEQVLQRPAVTPPSLHAVGAEMRRRGIQLRIGSAA